LRLITLGAMDAGMSSITRPEMKLNVTGEDTETPTARREVLLST
jgi:hypothetical protein